MLAEYSDAWASSQMYSEEIYRCSPTIGVIVREYCLAQYEASYLAGMQPAHLEGIFCQSGQLQVTTAQGTVTTVEAGELLLVTDAAAVRNFSFDRGCFRCIAAFFDHSAAGESFARACALLSGSPLHLEQVQALLNAHDGCTVIRNTTWGASCLASLCQLSKEQRGAYFLLKLWELFYLLCSWQAAGTVPHETGYCDHYQADVVRSVHDYMLAHFDQHLTVQELARRFQLSPTFLKNCFRRLYGTPIHAYLKHYRLQTAARLLCTTSESVLAVASSVGYTGTSQFGTAFKEYYHMTPAQYRRLYHQKNVQNR